MKEFLKFRELQSRQNQDEYNIQKNLETRNNLTLARLKHNYLRS